MTKHTSPHADAIVISELIESNQIQLIFTIGILSQPSECFQQRLCVCVCVLGMEYMAGGCERGVKKDGVSIWYKLGS